MKFIRNLKLGFGYLIASKIITIILILALLCSGCLCVLTPEDQSGEPWSVIAAIGMLFFILFGFGMAGSCGYGSDRDRAICGILVLIGLVMMIVGIIG